MKILNSFQIKLFMLLLMTLDHLGVLLPYEWARIFHIVSRPVAVWFAFAAVESFVHTRSRRDYVMRLYGAAAVMSAGNVLLSILMQAKPELAPDNNIFLTLAVGVSILWLLEEEWRRALRWVLIAILGIFMVTACEGGLLLLGTMLVCWAFREKPGPRSGVLAILFVLLSGTPVGNVSMSAIMLEFLANSSVACVGVLPFLHLYNGRRGPDGPVAKWFFYLYYPAHIWLIAWAAYAML